VPEQVVLVFEGKRRCNQFYSWNGCRTGYQYMRNLKKGHEAKNNEEKIKILSIKVYFSLAKLLKIFYLTVGGYFCERFMEDSK